MSKKEVWPCNAFAKQMQQRLDESRCTFEHVADLTMLWRGYMNEGTGYLRKNLKNKRIAATCLIKFLHDTRSHVGKDSRDVLDMERAVLRCLFKYGAAIDYRKAA